MAGIVVSFSDELTPSHVSKVAESLLFGGNCAVPCSCRPRWLCLHWSQSHWRLSLDLEAGEGGGQDNRLGLCSICWQLWTLRLRAHLGLQSLSIVMVNAKFSLSTLRLPNLSAWIWAAFLLAAVDHAQMAEAQTVSEPRIDETPSLIAVFSPRHNATVLTGLG